MTKTLLNQNQVDPLVVTEDNLSLSDVTTADFSLSQHGLVPKGVAGKVLGSGGWENPRKSFSHSLRPYSALAAPADNTTYYFGMDTNFSGAPTTVQSNHNSRSFIPFSCKLTDVMLYVSVIAGSNEAVPFSFVQYANSAGGVPVSTDAIVDVVMDGTTPYYVVNDLNIDAIGGQLFTIKIACPAWATNPTSLYLGAILVFSG
jgi:hypothetical protein